MSDTPEKRRVIIAISNRQWAALLSVITLPPTAIVTLPAVVQSRQGNVDQALKDNADFRELCVNVKGVVDNVVEIRMDNKALWQRDNDHQQAIAGLLVITNGHEERLKKVENRP